MTTEEKLTFLFEQGLEKIAAESGAGAEAEVGLTDEETQYVFDQGLEKIAAESSEIDMDPEFAESMEKVANHLGFDPEYLTNAIVAHRGELEKVAAAQQYVDGLSDEEVDNMLKEAAANDPEVAAAIMASEEEQENEELAKLAQMIDDLTDEQAEALLASTQEQKEG